MLSIYINGINSFTESQIFHYIEENDANYYIHSVKSIDRQYKF